MVNLVEKSLYLILKNQYSSGAFVACPKFENYKFSWLRDGSFIAHGLDLNGHLEEAEKFYKWINTVILRYKHKVDAIEEKIRNGEAIEKKDFLNARYTVDGYEEEEKGWGNFQLDAYGTWLWALYNHIKISNNYKLVDDFRESIKYTIKYIELLWNYPNCDIWEENEDKISTSTLACLYGGLNSINNYLKEDRVTALSNKIRTFILTNCVKDGRFVKYIGSDEVDSSLIWLSVPFNVVPLENQIYINTIKEIEKELLKDNGLKRYKKDTYYGGGQWILLSCFLGWYYKEKGDIEKARNILTWVEKQADEDFNLPEQVFHDLNEPEYLSHWINKWGEVSTPLLWSHGMYLILHKHLR